MIDEAGPFSPGQHVSDLVLQYWLASPYIPPEYCVDLDIRGNRRRLLDRRLGVHPIYQVVMFECIFLRPSALRSILSLFSRPHPQFRVLFISDLLVACDLFRDSLFSF